MYTINQLKSIRQCPLKGYLSQFNYKTEQTKYLHLLDLYKRAIKEGVENYSEFFDENISDQHYILDYNKTIDKNIFVKHLERYNKYIKENGCKIHKSDVSGYVEIEGESIYVKADVVFKNGNEFIVAKLSQSSPKLSYSATSDKNKPENNFELYLMKKLGEQIYENKNVSSAFFHLKGKYDEKENYTLFLGDEFSNKELSSLLSQLESEKEYHLAEGKKREANKVETQLKKVRGIIDFEGSKGSHIIKPEEFNMSYILNELAEITSTEVSIDSKPCKSNDCDKCNHQVLCMAKRFNKVDLEIVEEIKKENKNSKPNLTKGQQSYVGFKKGYARVKANPGGGKSFSTVLRTVELLKECEPSEILLITFTNSGAEELRNKIDKLTSVDKRNLNIYTFNSFGMGIIEKEYQKLGFTKVPEIITRIEKVELIKDIVNNSSRVDWLNYKDPLLNLPTARGAVYQLMDLFDEIKSFGIEEHELDKEIKIALYNAYNNKLREMNRIDYEDQVLLAMSILEDDNMVEKYGFKHIMVDEYQDTSLRQIQFLQQLNQFSGVESICGIGDDAQSVYGFRRTSPEYMINFQEYFPDFKDIFMIDNFRSTPEICDVCNEFIKLNENRINSDMTPNKPHGESVEVVEYNTVSEEYESVVNDIKKKIESGIEPQDIAILGRQSKELLELQTLLNQSDVPNKLATPQLYLNNHNIRLIINLSTYLVNKDNDLYLFEYVAGTTKKINEFNNKQEIDDFIIGVKNQIEDSKDRFENDFERFMWLTEKVRLEDGVCNKFVEDVLNEKSWNSFTEFASHLKKHVVYRDNSQSEKDETKYKAVTLTSMHSSKGLEWDTVYVLLDKLDYDEKDISNLEEERRLAYVAMSRAKEKLIMVYNTNQNKKRGTGKYSKMIDEIRGMVDGI